MYDIHKNKTLYLITAPDESQFTGTADGLLAPFGLYPESAARQCRVLFDHKQTEDQKQSYRENHPNTAGGSGKDAGPPGPVQYGAHKGQVLVCYLASLAINSFPLIYDLCDGETHNLLHLRDGFITVWEGLSPTQAYWKLSQLLQQFPEATEKRLRLEAIPEEFQVPLKKLRVLEPSSGILEQLESILPFVPESERVACTQELLAPWLQSSRLPESILHMYN
ncbi:hypothetical protein KFL_008290020 [Klebsormidium nitens]|uniref:Uncharacterized protein n=1 Tax=Klebsormidium nitens TaxID=105231 RepID=A0A1Y1ILZ3_KLENI|nr:hypothetical protein KFL_008290020 [Klebsormidium nitens]|eukprot:GAQ91663.1 hypothetical protein KFL_008290020 [Klebsormidium nitens]